MKSVQDIAKAILAREGGYVNDPDDPGGATNHGVTVHTMRRLGLDLNGDGKVDAQDVRVLTAEKALQIFVDEYFHKPGLGALPGPLQASVFDMYVNAGGNAVKILQRLLNQMRISVAVDGVIGPQTTQAATQAISAAPIILWMLTGLRGAITIIDWPMHVWRAANMPAGETAGRAVGSCVQKSFYPRNTI